MNTKAVRLYGKNDLRLEEFKLPPVSEDEILAQVITNSICMSSYKAAIQGNDHKRVPDDIDKNPVIIGHEFCGLILEVGKKWCDMISPGMKFSIQPALNMEQNPYAAPGYSYRFIGGNATHVIIPNEVMELGCLLEYTGDAYFYGSIAEPVSCIAGAFHANYHTKSGSYEHIMGIAEGGNMALLAGVGPMGLSAIDYAIHSTRKPSRLVVTDINKERLDRAASLYTVEEARIKGVELLYLNTENIADPVEELRKLTDGKGYDDVFVFAPVKSLVEQGDKILGKDGCLNFFAGPSNQKFTAEFNFYNVHYNSTHIVGTSGGNTADMIESLELMSAGAINPSSMVTHIGGLNSVVETVLNLPDIPGGKKLIYTNVSMELTAISDFRKKGEEDSMFTALADIVEKNNGLWCLEAEKYLMAHAKTI